LLRQRPRFGVVATKFMIHTTKDIYAPSRPSESPHNKAPSAKEVQYVVVALDSKDGNAINQYTTKQIPK